VRTGKVGDARRGVKPGARLSEAAMTTALTCKLSMARAERRTLITALFASSFPEVMLECCLSLLFSHFTGFAVRY